jgi:hypothetical protein
VPALPTTPDEALAWIQEAMAASRYIPDPHVYKQLQRRGMGHNIQHVKRAIATATRCEPYVPENGAKAGGTSWRVSGGTNLDGDATSVGVEAYYDTGQKRIVVITVFQD